MKRSLKLPLLIALALGSSQALALDLGQIQVKSALGQPLLAEIPVQKATPAELQKLSVQLASGDEFARAGVSAGRPAIPLHFEVVSGEGGHKVIRITSQTAVNDPFLDLLIEIHGGTGKSVREFTILLDPPGTNPAPVAARPTAPSRSPATAAAPEPRPKRSAPAESAQLANGKFGPIAHGQTLSAVARRTAPAGVDLNQMMLALRQANPDAFYRENINALKAGAVLRVPSKAEAEAVAVAAAAAQVRQQNGDWRSGRVASSPVTVADAGTRSATSSSPATSTAPKSDHLALVPAAKQGAKAAAAGNADHGSQQDLLRSQEAVASLQQQSDDLKSRLKDLTDINSKNAHLLALKDNQIAELQAKLAAARKAAGLPAEAVAANAAASASAAPVPVVAANAAKPTAAASAPVAAEAMAPATTGSAEPVASKPVAETPAAAAKTTPLKPTTTAAQPAAEEPWYMQLWAQALGGAIVVLLLLLALLGRRRGRKPTDKGSKAGASLADRFAASAASGAGDAEADADPEQTHLLDQLAEHPDDVGLHLELTSLYYERRDVEHFEAAAEAMHVHVADPHQEEWQEVVRMGEDLTPAHPLFAHKNAAATAVAAEPVPGFDIDHFDADDVTATAPAGKTVPASAAPSFPSDPVKVSEYNFNFDLTPAQEAPAAVHGAAVEPAAAKSVPTAAPVSDWHFDEPAPVSDARVPDIETFNDDPVDTKLDLARAYLDMGDPEGAKAMLEEVMQEGSQTQKDVAKRMIDDLH
ncbi:MAG: fimbrial protein FimV [Rhodanobacter sp.]|nr:MAG: fimbrial protein FimV [Rhodanobacter sp.]TAM12097.1 MAG: fimbrial protein FimV [Rhodanobacter sp.]TAM34562.1 MAG: fimbrial protein FimV [Rhodanobacter sp.]